MCDGVRVLQAGDLIDGAVVGVPGVVDAESGLVGLADNVPGLEGTAFGDELDAVCLAGVLWNPPTQALVHSTRVAYRGWGRRPTAGPARHCA